MSYDSVVEPRDVKLKEVACARMLFVDTDAMGVVSHAAFVRYVELARIELFRPLLPLFAEASIDLPLTDLQVSYHAPGRFDDELHLLAGVTELTRARVIVQYRFERHDDSGVITSVSSAETRHAYLREGKAIRLPKTLVAEVEHRLELARTVGVVGRRASRHSEG